MTIASSASSSTFYPVFVANTGSQAEYINTTNLQVVPSSGNVIIAGTLTTGGAVLPSTDNTINLGSSSNRWANIYTGDMNLSNQGSLGNEVDQTTGSWSIQEGDENLYVINRRTGKHYKMVLQEV